MSVQRAVTASRKATGVFLGVAVSVVLLAACGGGSNDATPTSAPATAAAGDTTPAADATAGAPATPPQASSGEIDACTLVSKAEVEAAIGTTVLDPKPQQFPNLSSCDFNDPATPVFRLASVTVVTEPSGDGARSLFDLGKSNANDPQTIDGIGEDAYWDETLSTLDTLKGKYEVSVSVSPGEGVDKLTAAKAIAAKVVANLP
jgi:hypothetical protein